MPLSSLKKPEIQSFLTIFMALTLVQAFLSLWIFLANYYDYETTLALSKSILHFVGGEAYLALSFHHCSNSDLVTVFHFYYRCNKSRNIYWMHIVLGTHIIYSSFTPCHISIPLRASVSLVLPLCLGCIPFSIWSLLSEASLT